MEKKLETANKFVAQEKEKLSQHMWRLQYHPSPSAYWMNDPKM
ncbi:hypothetical protein ACFFHM_03915 [Halalkalibacter kiskunsagensis]|uniref:Uncharacterized protein n=1 Tax=Halalkalibacter kiskunsagensis TaxID=1548599 RepID=A0ABV6K8R8_9BACI